MQSLLHHRFTLYIVFISKAISSDASKPSKVSVHERGGEQLDNLWFDLLLTPRFCYKGTDVRSQFSTVIYSDSAPYLATRLSPDDNICIIIRAVT